MIDIMRIMCPGHDHWTIEVHESLRTTFEAFISNVAFEVLGHLNKNRLFIVPVAEQFHILPDAWKDFSQVA